MYIEKSFYQYKDDEHSREECGHIIIFINNEDDVGLYWCCNNTVGIRSYNFFTKSYAWDWTDDKTLCNMVLYAVKEQVFGIDTIDLVRQLYDKALEESPKFAKTMDKNLYKG